MVRGGWDMKVGGGRKGEKGEKGNLNISKGGGFVENDAFLL